MRSVTPDGGRVTVAVHDCGDAVTLTVGDTGVGIAEQLFTRFFRAQTAGELAIQGSGLGLAIVKSIVTLHDGTVSLTSAPGTGTEVRVSLPRGERASAADPTRPGADDQEDT